MLVHESPEKLTVQEDPGWGWGLGGVLAALGVVGLAASAGVFRGILWADSLTRGFAWAAGLGVLLVGLLLLLRPKDWILEMDRKEKKMLLYRKGPWPRRVNAWAFGEVRGTRLVELGGPDGSWSLEILVGSTNRISVAHRFRSDKAGCERACRAIERILGEPPWEAPAVSLRARIRM